MRIEDITQKLPDMSLSTFDDEIVSIYDKIPFLGDLNDVSLAFIKALLVLFLTFIIRSIFKQILLRLHKKLAKTGHTIDTALTVALKKPIIIFIWVIGISIALQIINPHVGIEKLGIFIFLLRKVGLFICISWFSYRFINQYQRKFIVKRELLKKPVDRTTVEAVTRLTKIFVAIVLILYLMQDLGVKIGGLLAFGGISGVAIGFAAKDLLSNFFGAIMIYLDKPFSIGDWIKSPDRDIEGVVDSIGWRQTKVIAFEKHPIYIPNSIFSTIVLENRSRMISRRIKEYIGVRYDDIARVQKITDDIKEMLKTHPAINKKQTMLVNFEKFSESSLDIMVYTFTNTIEWAKYQTVKQDVLLRIAEIIDKNGAEIAFPTTTTHYTQEKEDKTRNRHIKMNSCKEAMKEMNKMCKRKGTEENDGGEG